MQGKEGEAPGDNGRTGNQVVSRILSVGRYLFDLKLFLEALPADLTVMLIQAFHADWHAAQPTVSQHGLSRVDRAEGSVFRRQNEHSKQDQIKNKQDYRTPCSWIWRRQTGSLISSYRFRGH